MTDEGDDDVADWLKDADAPADDAGDDGAPADAPVDDPLDWPPSEGAAGADDATEWERSPRGDGDDGWPTDAGESATDTRERTTDAHDPATDANEPMTDGEQSGRTGSGGDDAPLGDVAGDVRERRARASDRPDERLFEEQDVTEIDADVVWDRLEGDDSPATPDASEREVRVVEKGEYCEHCPFFSPPPDVHCSNEGTEILELVDMEHFRVVDCPKVRENERLEQL